MEREQQAHVQPDLPYGASAGTSPMSQNATLPPAYTPPSSIFGSIEAYLVAIQRVIAILDFFFQNKP